MPSVVKMRHYFSFVANNDMNLTQLPLCNPLARVFKASLQNVIRRHIGILMEVGVEEQFILHEDQLQGRQPPLTTNVIFI